MNTQDFFNELNLSDEDIKIFTEEENLSTTDTSSDELTIDEFVNVNKKHYEQTIIINLKHMCGLPKNREKVIAKGLYFILDFFGIEHSTVFREYHTIFCFIKRPKFKEIKQMFSFLKRFGKYIEHYLSGYLERIAIIDDVQSYWHKNNDRECFQFFIYVGTFKLLNEEINDVKVLGEYLDCITWFFDKKTAIDYIAQNVKQS